MKTIKLIKVFYFFGASIFALTLNKSFAVTRDLTSGQLADLSNIERNKASQSANNPEVSAMVELLNAKISTIERMLNELERLGRQNTIQYSQLAEKKTELNNRIAEIRRDQQNKIYEQRTRANDLALGANVQSRKKEEEYKENRMQTEKGYEIYNSKLSLGMQEISRKLDPWDHKALIDALNLVLNNTSKSIGDIYKLPDKNMISRLSESSISNLISLGIYPEAHMQILGKRANFNTLFLDSFPTKDAEAEPLHNIGLRLFNDNGIESLNELREAKLILINTDEGPKININYVVKVVNKFALGHKLNPSEAQVFEFVTNRIFLFSGLINFFRISIAHKQKSRLDEMIASDLIKIVQNKEDRFTFLVLIESDAYFGFSDFTPPRSLEQLRRIANNKNDFKARVMEYLFESVDMYKILDVYERALLTAHLTKDIKNNSQNRVENGGNIENFKAIVKAAKKAFFEAHGLEGPRIANQLKEYPVCSAVEEFRAKKWKNPEQSETFVFGNFVSPLFNSTPINSCYLYYK